METINKCSWSAPYQATIRQTDLTDWRRRFEHQLGLPIFFLYLYNTDTPVSLGCAYVLFFKPEKRFIDFFFVFPHDIRVFTTCSCRAPKYVQYLTVFLNYIFVLMRFLLDLCGILFFLFDLYRPFYF